MVNSHSFASPSTHSHSPFSFSLRLIFLNANNKSKTKRNAQHLLFSSGLAYSFIVDWSKIPEHENFGATDLIWILSSWQHCVCVALQWSPPINQSIKMYLHAFTAHGKITHIYYSFAIVCPSQSEKFTFPFSIFDSIQCFNNENVDNKTLTLGNIVFGLRQFFIRLDSMAEANSKIENRIN